jgi:hypothetical protein
MARPLTQIDILNELKSDMVAAADQHQSVAGCDDRADGCALVQLDDKWQAYRIFIFFGLFLQQQKNRLRVVLFVFFCFFFVVVVVVV